MDKWRRVSPIALLYFFFSNLKFIVNNIIYLVPIIFTSYDKIINNPWWVFLAIFAALSLLIISAFLQFYFFKYRLNEQSIEINSGVIFKKNLHLPYTRIQNVKLISPLYFRPFGFTCVELDTAGSNKNEAKIVALEVAQANNLKQEILTNTQPEEHNEPSTTPTNNEEILNQRALKDLIIHGVTNNRIWIFVAALAPMADNIVEYMSEFTLSIGLDFTDLFSPQIHAWWQIASYALLALIISYGIVMLLSVFGSIIAFYGYTLSKHGETYIRRSGLLTHHEVVMKLPRLQLVIWQQDWLDVLIKRVNLKFEQSNANLKNPPGMDIRNKIMVPSIEPTQFNQLIDDVWPTNQLASIAFSPISKRFIYRHIFVVILPLHLMIGAFILLNNHWQNLATLIPTFVISSLLIIARWYRWGFAIDHEFIYLRKGLLGVNYYTFPVHKIQQTKFKQSWFMERRGLSTMVLVLASGAQKIPFISTVQANKIIDFCLYQVESSKQNWM
ncbi:MAG: PH domain-containing protein [Gammaproteobacteria bacterium]|nr:PH domain-containing protein [Gammaproteobacteria bacterium]